MDDSLFAAYGQLKLLADALQGTAPTACATFIMPMRPLGGGEPVPVLCVAVNDEEDQRTGMFPIAVMHPTDEKMFEDPTADEVQAAMEASMTGVIEHGGGCLCGRCARRFPRDDASDGPFNFN